MVKHLTVKETICRLSENDLVRNIDKGAEYTGFKELYCESMMGKKHVSQFGHVYDISNYDDSSHLLDLLKRIDKEEAKPEVIMTSGTFFSMNEKLQKEVTHYLASLAQKGSVRLYVSDKHIPQLFKDSKVQVKVFDRNSMSIIHFIKTPRFFNFVMPHTEKKTVRVDINSDTFEPQKAELIFAYLDKLVMELDRAIENNNRMDTNADSNYS